MIPIDWLTKTFLPFFRKYLRKNNIKYVKNHQFTCVHFTNLFIKLLREEVYKVLPNLKGLAFVHRLTVDQKKRFGGIPVQKDILHRLATVEANTGKIVVEPQSGKWCLWEDYPNRLYTIRETL
jgi:hypothetical protein